MKKIEIELNEIPSDYFITMAKTGRLVAYASTRERALDLSAASGEPAPWIVKASTFQGYPFYSIKVKSEGECIERIINEKERKRLFDEGLGNINPATLRG